MRSTTLIPIIVLGVLTSYLEAQQLPDTIIAPAPASGGTVGRFLGASQNWAILGDYTFDQAFVYELVGSTWTLSQTIAGVGGGSFGHEIAVDGDWLFVGAITRSLPASPGLQDGAVDVFQYDSTLGSWTLTEELAPDTASNAGWFGRSIDIDQSTAAVGVEQPFSGYGRVFIYDRTGSDWNQTTILTPPAGPMGEFGYKTALSGDWLAVGEPGFFSTHTGRVVLYERDSGGNWSESQIIDGNVPSSGFGYSLRLIDDRLIVGTESEGAVRYYQNTGANWVLAQTITSGSLNFGKSLDVDASELAVSDWGESVKVYSRDGSGLWQLSRTLTVAPPFPTEFGREVSLADEFMLVNSNESFGSSYIYDRGLSIVAHPADSSLCEGESITLSVAALGPTPLTYQWMKDGVEIAGATSASLAIGPAVLSDAGSYVVQVSDALAASLDSDSADIVVDQYFLPPTVTASALGICSGSVTLTASTLPGTTVEWFEGSCGGIPLGTGNSIDVTPTATTEYFARVAPAPCASPDCASITIVFGATPAVPTSASVSESLVCYGTEVFLTATAADPTNTIRWYEGGCGVNAGTVVGETGSGVAIGVTSTAYPATTYYAKSLDVDCESDQCLAVDVTFVAVASATLISSDVTICAGESITLEAEAPTDPLDIVVWSEACFGGSETVGEHYLVAPSESTIYYARVQNTSGCMGPCQAVTVTVLQPPTVTLPAGPVQFCGAIDLAVDVEGTAMIQWYKDAIAIAGATSEQLLIDPAGSDDAGAYTVQATNACGQVTTAPIELVALPTVFGILGTPADLLTTGGTDVTFSGVGFDSTLTVTVISAFGASLAEVVDATGDQVLVTMPAIAPGCDCSDGTTIPAEVSFETDCGQAVATVSMEYVVAPILVSPYATQVERQLCLDNAVPGDCIVFEGDDVAPDHAGPLELNNKSLVTITTSDGVAVSALATGTPTEATLRIADCDDTVCVSHLTFIHGNSGLEIGSSSESLIYNCRFTKNEQADLDHGGGITIIEGSNPTIRACEISGNITAGSGGGICLIDADATIVDSLIAGNEAAGAGGGIYIRTVGHVEIRGNEIVNHGSEPDPGSPGSSVSFGGGVCWITDFPMDPLDPPIATGVVANNTIRSNLSEDFGGGIYLGRYVAPDVLGNDIDSNRTLGCDSKGGGVFVESQNDTPFTLCGNIVRRNVSQVGGGIMLLDKCRATVEHNLIYCNEVQQLCEIDGKGPMAPPPPSFFAAGLYLDGVRAIIRHNTIFSNTGSSIVNQGGGLHFIGAALTPLRIHDNVFTENEHWQAYSGTVLPAGGDFFYDNLGWCSAIAGPAFHSNLAPSMSTYIDPLLVAPSCESNTPWADFGLSSSSIAIELGGESSTIDDLGAVPFVGDLPECAQELDFNDCDGDGVEDEIQIASNPSLDSDGDGVLDVCTSPTFRRGDANSDTLFDIGDAIFTLSHLFSGGADPSCEDSADANDDGNIDIGDAIFTLSALFSSGALPPSPGDQNCGVDPTPDTLECGAPCP